MNSKRLGREIGWVHGVPKYAVGKMWKLKFQVNIDKRTMNYTVHVYGMTVVIGRVIFTTSWSMDRYALRHAILDHFSNRMQFVQRTKFSLGESVCSAGLVCKQRTEIAIIRRTIKLLIAFTLISPVLRMLRHFIKHAYVSPTALSVRYRWRETHLWLRMKRERWVFIRWNSVLFLYLAKIQWENEVQLVRRYRWPIGWFANERCKCEMRMRSRELLQAVGGTKTAWLWPCGISLWFNEFVRMTWIQFWSVQPRNHAD